MALNALERSCRLRTLSAFRRALKKARENLEHVDSAEMLRKLNTAYALFKSDTAELHVDLRHLVSEKVAGALARMKIFTVVDALNYEIRDIRIILREGRVEMPTILRYLHIEK